MRTFCAEDTATMQTSANSTPEKGTFMLIGYCYEKAPRRKAWLRHPFFVQIYSSPAFANSGRGSYTGSERRHRMAANRNTRINTRPANDQAGDCDRRVVPMTNTLTPHTRRSSIQIDLLAKDHGDFAHEHVTDDPTGDPTDHAQDDGARPAHN